MYIYTVTNRVNGKVYVGRSKRPEQRWKQHKYWAVSTVPSKTATVLCNAIAKYGASAFDFRIVEECQSVEEACSAERRWIAELKSLTSEGGYNQHSGGNGASYVSLETRRKLTLAVTGRRHSKETLRRLSEAQKNRSPEVNRKIGDALRGKPRPYARALGLAHIDNLLLANQKKRLQSEERAVKALELLKAGTSRQEVATQLGISVSATYVYVPAKRLRSN